MVKFDRELLFFLFDVYTSNYGTQGQCCQASITLFDNMDKWCGIYRDWRHQLCSCMKSIFQIYYILSPFPPLRKRSNCESVNTDFTGCESVNTDVIRWNSLKWGIPSGNTDCNGLGLNRGIPSRGNLKMANENSFGESLGFVLV